jgi:hypothetical protein
MKNHNSKFNAKNKKIILEVDLDTDDIGKMLDELSPVEKLCLIRSMAKQIKRKDLKEILDFMNDAQEFEDVILEINSMTRQMDEVSNEFLKTNET